VGSVQESVTNPDFIEVPSVPPFWTPSRSAHSMWPNASVGGPFQKHLLVGVGGRQSPHRPTAGRVGPVGCPSRNERSLPELEHGFVRTVQPAGRRKTSKAGMRTRLIKSIAYSSRGMHPHSRFPTSSMVKMLPGHRPSPIQATSEAVPVHSENVGKG
jgi:hypothetical protein